MIKNVKISTIFYTVFFLFITAYSSKTSAYDYDIWARLLVGKYFFQTGHILKHDLFSYAPTHLFYDHEWGSGIIFYLVQHLFTHVGLLLLHIILLFLIVFVVTKIVELREVKTTTAYNFLFYYFAFSAMGYLTGDIIRCQTFTFLFFAVFIYILELSRKGQIKPLWLLPVIMPIWNNLHGGCVAGIGLILLYILGEFLNQKPFKQYLLPLLLTILVLPINPWGIHYLAFLYKATTMPRPEIIEWQNLFSDPYTGSFIEFKVFSLVLILAEIVFIFKQKQSNEFKMDYTKYLIIFATLYLAIAHTKMIPFAVIALTCFLYDDFYTVFNSLTLNVMNNIARYKDALVYSIILIYIVFNINAKLFEPFCDWSKFPIRVIEFIRINNIKGNLFIDFSYGSYAIYKLYPHNKVFMDGRYEEVYPDYMMPTLNRFLLAKEKNWDDVITKYHTDLILVGKNYPVNSKLLKSSEWKKIFEDNSTALYIKTKDVKKEYKYPSRRLSDYKKTLFYTDADFKIDSAK